MVDMHSLSVRASAAGIKRGLVLVVGPVNYRRRFSM
jgi:hypothetical protein